MLIQTAIIVFAAASAALLLWHCGPLRASTLVPALWWVSISIITIAAGETLVFLFTADKILPPWTAAVRLAAATSTFCPVVAVLGARRPQHLAWQFIVISMWIMLSLPAWEALFLSRYAAIDVGPVRGWFLWLMIAVNFVTYLPTRSWAASLLVTLGQLLLLAPFLPILHVTLATTMSSLVALVCFTSAIVLTCRVFAAPRMRANEYDQRWIRFRDMFGTMWALRVLERINAAATMYDWPMSLTWSGFYFHDVGDKWETVSAKDEQELQQTLDNLLRRFM